MLSFPTTSLCRVCGGTKSAWSELSADADV
eukprot:COSAG05_NODE_27071_length_169_cov_27.614286_1_plen_29_part_01